MNSNIIKIIVFSGILLSVNIFAQNSIVYPEGYNTITGQDTTGNYLNKNNSSIKTSYTLKINEICASNGTIISDENGDFDDWIEIYNYGSLDIDLEGLYFTDDALNPSKFRMDSSIIVTAGDFVVLWVDNQAYQGRKHLGFSLSSSGESVIISDEILTLIDQVNYSNINYNTTYGCQPDGSTSFNYFTSPTPNASNNSAQGLLDILPEPIISVNSGFYTSTQTVSITETVTDCNIYYTTNGNEPNASSSLYTIPISVSANTSLRVKAYKTDYIPSISIARTYIFEEASTIPVLYITSESSNIFETSDAHIYTELVDENNQQLFALNAGSQLHGDNSAPQKSFKLFFRSMYGSNEVNGQLFEHKDINRFKRLIFRAAGNDGTATAGSERAHMRDGINATLVNTEDFNFTAPAYRAVNVYLNGEYWGIFNMRERPDKYYMADNYNYDADLPMNLMEYQFGYTNSTHVVEGEKTDFFDTHTDLYNDGDLSQQVDFDIVANKYNVEDFADYWIFETYIGNFDWLSNNIIFWKPLVPTGKYRWVLWDTDHGIGLPYSSYGDPSWNTLEWCTSTWAGRPWSGGRTAIIRALLTNPDFKYHFITRFADLINSSFTPETFTEVIDTLENKITSELPKQFEKWGGSSETSWASSFNTIRNYVDVRPAYVRNHIKSKFSLEEMYDLELDVTPEHSGKFNLNTITIDNQLPWEGKYYKTMKITVEAIALPGYQFTGWENSTETSALIELFPNDDTELVAIFEPIVADTNSIIFNEISYNQSVNFDSEDWVEFYNKSNSPINMSEWTFKDNDDNHIYNFPQGFILNNDEYIVVCSNQSTFTSTYPSVSNYLSSFNFGLSGSGELIRLYNSNNEIIDSVIYSDSSPWPANADGNGPTLELINTTLNNFYGVNWQSSYINGGTPGITNSDSNTLNKIILTKNIIIYPNPTKDKINIETENNATISIINIKGKKYFESNINIGINTIDFSVFPQGVYFIKIIEANNTVVKKVVKL